MIIWASPCEKGTYHIGATAKAQASLRIRAVSSESSYETRDSFR